MIFYYFIFFSIVAILFLSRFFTNRKEYVMFFIAVILILIAGFKTIGVDMDSVTYVEVFNSVGSPGSYFTDYQDNSFFEPAYYLIPSILTNYFKLDVVWVFFTFAILGVTLKFIAISKLTDFAFLSIIVYFSHFFLLHELTQIRAGVASGILLLSIIEIERRNFLRFLLLIVAGMLFHYSMIIFLPFYFLSSKEINKKFYISFLIVPYILIALNINIIKILQLFHLGVFSEKIEMYNDLLSLGVFDKIKTYNVVTLMQLLLCFLFIIKSDLLISKNKYSLLLTKIYCLAASFLVMFSNIPVLAIRIGELLTIVQIILVPFLLYIIRPKYVALLLIISFALVTISINLLYTPILKPYFGLP